MKASLDKRIRCLVGYALILDTAPQVISLTVFLSVFHPCKASDIAMGMVLLKNTN